MFDSQSRYQQQQQKARKKEKTHTHAYSKMITRENLTTRDENMQLYIHSVLRI